MSYLDTMVKPCLIDRYKVKDSIFNGGMFNGLEYQVVTNPVTGRQWLDRNLGATRVATAVNDSQAYGWLFQWGRLADGHQLRTSPTRNVQSTGDVPGHQNFIIGFNDWRNPVNNNLWQGVDAINNVAPAGWRLPTQAEWDAERLTWGSSNSVGAFGSMLKLTLAGFRDKDNASFGNAGVYGYYWFSDISSNNSMRVYFWSGGHVYTSIQRAYGFPVRLIKNI